MQDIVIYDGRCSFCRFQISLLRTLDICKKLKFISLYDDIVSEQFPMLSREDLLKQMYVVSSTQFIYGGAEAIRYLSRRLILLWPMAILLHIPYSMFFWDKIYRFIARNRYLIAGKCSDSCAIK